MSRRRRHLASFGPIDEIGAHCSSNIQVTTIRGVMSAVASIGGFMKRHVIGPALIRRNPIFYGRARAVLEEIERQDLDQRRAWSEAQLKRTFQFARRAAYGRKVNGGDTLDTWPLLEKENLRDRQD